MSSTPEPTVITYAQVLRTLELMPKLVVRARIERGIPQWEAARQMGIKGSTLCQFETGARQPQLWTLIKIFRWLAADPPPKSETARRAVIGCRML